MNTQSLILQIQMALSQLKSTPEPTLRNLAQNYADATATLNTRLMRCVLYLRQGFRSEALRLCETEPNLLDAINQLNFPQRAAWVSVAGQLGVNTLDLSIPLAMEINDAYDVFGKVKQLCAEHRYLNTVRASVQDRSNVLRALQAQEPQNPAWREGLTRLSQSS